MTLRTAAALVIVCAAASPSGAQSFAVEVQQSQGVSSESITAVGTQARLIGEVTRGVRFALETAWGARNRDESDVFGTAYPYDRSVSVISAYVAWEQLDRRGLRAIKAGRFRTPFGISEASDHAYVGFLRAPLMRYPGYWGLSNEFLEHGVSVLVGTPHVSVEVAAGRNSDVGEARRQPGWDGVARVEVAAGRAILGASVIDTTPNYPTMWAHGRLRFGGVDARWMHGGLMLRGEWIVGTPHDGTKTRGGYIDMTVHRPRLGPVTLVTRAERLAYDAEAPFALYTHRYTAGTRVRVWRGIDASVGIVHQAGQLTQRRATAIDVGVSYAIRHNF
jgi:hypothetical protein